jgi:cytoskeletal protein CcmA (bactofilin family)
MWNKNETPGTPAARTPSSPAPSSSPAPWTPSDSGRVSGMTARTPSCLGAGLTIKGQISGEEDLQIDGKVEGAISLAGQRLTVGRSAQLESEVTAREVVVYGKLTGNLRAHDRVEIKKDGSVVGDITTARISIEDGAYFKGRIEIDRTAHPVEERKEKAIPVPTAAAMAN